MRPALDPFRLLLISLAGWLNQHQQAIIDCPQEERTSSSANSWEVSSCVLMRTSADAWR